MTSHRASGAAPLDNCLVGIPHGCLASRAAYVETTAWSRRPENQLVRAA